MKKSNLIIMALCFALAISVFLNVLHATKTPKITITAHNQMHGDIANFTQDVTTFYYRVDNETLTDLAYIFSANFPSYAGALKKLREQNNLPEDGTIKPGTIIEFRVVKNYPPQQGLKNTL